MSSCSLPDHKLKESSLIGSKRCRLSASLFFELLLKAKLVVEHFDELWGGVEVNRGGRVEIAGVLEFILLGAELRKAVVGSFDVVVETSQGHILQRFHDGHVEAVMGTLFWCHRTHVVLMDFQGNSSVLAAVAVVGVLVVDLALGFVVRLFRPDRGLSAQAFGELWVDFPAREHRVVGDVVDGAAEVPGQGGVVVKAVLEDFWDGVVS